MVSRGGKGCQGFRKRVYVQAEDLTRNTLTGDFIAMAMSSVADLCVIPMQDYLNLGSSARINIPSNAWRQLGMADDEETVLAILSLTRSPE